MKKYDFNQGWFCKSLTRAYPVSSPRGATRGEARANGRKAAFRPCGWRTWDAFAAMDTAGCRYGVPRYEKGCKK